MKIDIQRSGERGGADLGWLLTKYSFSFADYYNPERMNFGALRVLNEDVIKPGGGFPPHSHADMEIVTIVLSGALEHRDSTGGRGVIRPGEVQRMSAGTGVTHSEFNHADKDLHLLQIWVDTKKRGLKPSYEQKKISTVKNKLVKIVSNNDNKALSIGQDCEFFLGELEKGKRIEFSFRKGYGLYLFVIEGSVRIGEHRLNKSDAAGISGTSSVKMLPMAAAKVLLITVPLK